MIWNVVNCDMECSQLILYLKIYGCLRYPKSPFKSYIKLLLNQSINHRVIDGLIFNNHILSFHKKCLSNNRHEHIRNPKWTVTAFNTKGSINCADFIFEACRTFLTALRSLTSRCKNNIIQVLSLHLLVPKNGLLSGRLILLFYSFRKN